MPFNLDPSIQAVEILFSRKKTSDQHDQVFFNNLPILAVPVHKHLGLYLDQSFNFQHHLKEKNPKLTKELVL